MVIQSSLDRQKLKFIICSLLAMTGALFSGCQQVDRPESASNQASTSNSQGKWDGEIQQFGEMHEVIGMQQHEGRVKLSELVAQPHFYGVGAIEGLKGELTILDGKILATSAPTQAELTPIHVTDETQATLLIGDHVDQWTPIELDADYVGSAFEDQIKKLAQQQGLDTSKPFPFWIKGPILNMEFHVIRGACPVHAQKKGIELSDDEKPFHHHVDQVDGQLVGVFALGAAGKITHPGTSMHVHVVFTEDQQTNEITGHVERFGVAKGAVLYLPK